MKNILKLLLLFLILFNSCSSDDDEISNEENNTEETAQETETPEEMPIAVITATETCLFSDFDIQENETVTIDCLLDLEGQTINLPAGVTFNFDGGDIFNGSLNFAQSGRIAGELLNADLTIDGNVTLIDEEFQFYPERWDIIEGTVSADVAESNKVKINDLLNFVTQLKQSDRLTFNIDELDAYFKVDGFNSHGQGDIRLGIKIPSDLNLNLTDNSYIRMFPNGNPQPALVFIGDGVENISINGGHFIGDRDAHDYSDGGTHEWGHIVRIGGAKNINVSNAEFIDAAGDGIDVHAFGHSFDDNHISTSEVYITDNTFIRNRRNQISVTSGFQIFIENNNFIDGSIHTDFSNGIAPGFAIDVEAFRSGGVEFEIAEDIFIRNNTESGSRIGAFTVHTGDRVTIETNTVEGGISYTNSIGTTIKNNTITAGRDTQITNGIAITAGRVDRFERNHGNIVIDNTITNYSIGIVATNVDLQVNNNEILNCSIGIALEDIKRAEFYDNRIVSNREGSIGFTSGAASSFVDDVIISQTNPNETLIDVQRDPFKFTFLNNEEEFKDFTFTIDGNTVTSPNTSTLSSHGIIFTNNIVLEGGIRLANTERTTIANNTITTTVANAIRIDSNCRDIVINNNILSTRQLCIWENNTDSVNIEIRDNACSEE